MVKYNGEDKNVINEEFQEYMIQANTLMTQEKYEDAIIYLKKAEQIDNMNTDVYITKGIAYANCEKYSDAKAEFEKTLKINRNSGVALFHLGNIEILTGNKAKGMELFNNSIARGFDDAQVYFSLGLMHEEADNEELAIRNYSKAIQKDPNRPDIRIRKIRILIKNNFLLEALQSNDELILSNPDVFEGYHLKFLMLVSLKRYEEAESVIKHAMELFPKDSAFALDKASLMITKKEYNEALDYLKWIQEDMELDYNAEHSIAMEKSRIYASQNDMDKAIISLREAKSILANQKLFDIEATYLLMSCYLNNKEFEKVIIAAKEIKKVKSEDYYVLAAHYYEPFALKRMGDIEKANRLFEESICYYRSKSLKHPNNIDCYTFRVMSLRELGELDKALELSDFLIKVNGESSVSHVLRATVLEVLGRDVEARDERSVASSLD